MVKIKSCKKEVNQIHENELWTSTIAKEAYASRTWNDRWGFYKQEENDKLPSIGDRDAQNMTAKGMIPSKFTKELVTDQESDLGAYLHSYKIDQLRMHYWPQEKYTYPPSTSLECGWTWNKEKQVPFAKHLNRPNQNVGYYSLEKFPTNHGLRDPLKWWGGDQESLLVLRKHRK